MATIETKIAKNEMLICKFNGKRVAWHNALAELENNPVGTVVAGNGHSYTCITNNVPAPEGLTYETGYLFEDENGNRYIFDNAAFAIRAIAYNNVDEYAVTQDATVEETAIVEAEIVEVKTASEMKAAYAASRAVVRVHFTAKGNLAWRLIYHYGFHDRETGYQRISKKEAAAELAQFGLTTEQVIAVEKAQAAINAEENEAYKTARAEGRYYTSLDAQEVYGKALAMVFGKDEPATVETVIVETKAEPAAEFAAASVAPAKVLALPAPVAKKTTVKATAAELPPVIYLPAPAAVEKANVENATAEAVEVNVEKATFAVGKTYVSDWETEYTVIKRTAKTVTIVPVIYVDDYEDISENPFVKTRRIHSDNNGEILSFNGSEGEALINAGAVITIRATDEVKSEAPAVEEPAAEVNEEVTHLQEKSTDISAQLVKLAAVKNVLTDAEYNAKAGELKDTLNYVDIQIDATNAEDDFDYRAAEEHIENCYHDCDNFIRYNVSENGLTQEQCEIIYAAAHADREFSNPDFDLIDRMVEEYKRANAGDNNDDAPTEPAPESKTANVDAETLNRQAKLYTMSGKVFGAISEALTPPVDCDDETADQYESAYQTLKAARVQFSASRREFDKVKRDHMPELKQWRKDAVNDRLNKVSAQVKAMFDAAISETPAPVVNDPIVGTEITTAFESDYGYRNYDVNGESVKFYYGESPTATAMLITSTQYGAQLYRKDTGNIEFLARPNRSDNGYTGEEQILDAAEFFKVMAERGACTIDQPTLPKPGSPCAIANGLNDIFNNTVRGIGYMDVTTQGGAKIVTNFGAAFIAPDWRAVDGYVFGNHCDDVLARYETAQQVIDVMTALRDAIKRGDTEFAFPPVEALTAPPEPETPATVDKKKKTNYNNCRR